MITLMSFRRPPFGVLSKNQVSSLLPNMCWRCSCGANCYKTEWRSLEFPR